MVDEKNLTKKARERVLIAKDALKWEVAGALIAANVGYVSPVDFSASEFFENYAQARDVHLGKCRVCALGGLLLAKAVRYDKVVCRQLFSSYPQSSLGDHFDHGQLVTIEACYEGWDWVASDATRWYLLEASARFRAIMRNIIRHKGTFVPGDVRP